MDLFVKSKEQFNESETFNEEFLLQNILKAMILLYIFFVLSPKNVFFCDFLCFPFCVQFPWFFRVFRIVENLPL